MGQAVAFATGQLHLRGQPVGRLGVGGRSPRPRALPHSPTLLCRLRVRQESPSRIHMARKVLLTISHSCQMLRAHGAREAGREWGARGGSGGAGRAREALLTPAHPKTPL